MGSPRFHGPLLRSVSRSFYLSIRILPARLREPVALAYLLARATDTVADTARISGTLRAETLQTLSNAIQSKAPPSSIDSVAAASSPVRVAHPSRSTPVGSIVDLVASFAPLQAFSHNHPEESTGNRGSNNSQSIDENIAKKLFHDSA